MFCFVALAASVSGAQAVPKAADEAKVCFQKVCVQAETADTDASRTRGLMSREKLEPGTGMLFVFPNDARHSFWMKNMRFALDIIWIDSDGKVVDLEPNVAPCLAGECPGMTPKLAARYVLEVPAGFTGKNRITIGNRVTFSLP